MRMVYIKCKVCDTGSLVRQRKYRMSGPVVLIGYILLIPSVLGILFSILMFFGAASSATGAAEAKKTHVAADMREAGVPDYVRNAVVQGNKQVVDEWSGSNTDQSGGTITGVQVQAAREAQTKLNQSNEGGDLAFGLLGGFSLFFGVLCFVGGLLGWLLVMKKWVLECGVCKAVVNAS